MEGKGSESWRKGEFNILWIVDDGRAETIHLVDARRKKRYVIKRERFGKKYVVVEDEEVK